MFFVVRSLLDVPIAGSLGLFLLGVVLYLFFATALGLFLGTISRSMAQFALLIILVVIVLQLLSGGNTPVESQPLWMQRLTLFLPSRHFVSFSQAIIFRGRARDRLAAISLRCRHRACLFCLQPPAVPQVYRCDQVGDRDNRLGLRILASAQLARRRESRSQAFHIFDASLRESGIVPSRGFVGLHRTWSRLTTLP